MDSKQSYEKHFKYNDFYKTQQSSDDEYWGLGIENESYIMFEDMTTVSREFIKDNRLPERYSVDYWKNFKYARINQALNRLPSAIKMPVYVNSYGFRNTDLLGEHATIYTKGIKENPLYSGQSIDEYLRRISPEFNHFFEKNLIYDGDTFEFTTFNFYKASVTSVIDELKTIKANVLAELNRRLVSKFTIFKKALIYPPFNYGFVRFQTNLENVSVCNNGTYHINITLPTKLAKDGGILHPEEFRAQHANAIRAIQWIEPFLVGLYGSPDILHILDSSYAAGSLRLAMSRYIGLGTYDSMKMEKGKLLDTCKYIEYNEYNNDCHNGPVTYFSKMHENSPYIPPKKIGYDFNYNKFKKHGIELRFFDYFPEQHLESVINLLILVCQHSLLQPVPDPRACPLWNDLSAAAIMQGSDAKISDAMFTRLCEVFGVLEVKTCWRSLMSGWYFTQKGHMKSVAKKLSDHLYANYKSAPICLKISPNMKPIKIIDYNSIIKMEYKKMTKNWSM